jgi:hypothetical protein
MGVAMGTGDAARATPPTGSFATAGPCGVAVVTQRHKVALVHPQVRRVRDLDDVMRLCCWGDAATLLAVQADRMR